MTRRELAKKSLPESFDFQKLVELIEQANRFAQSQANRAINHALVARNWSFGWYIVEFEQKGEDRAKYGDKLIDELAVRLNFRGSSATNLRKFREFYRGYSIQQTVSVESSSRQRGEKDSEFELANLSAHKPILQLDLTQSGQYSEETYRNLSHLFPLSWSHYVALLSVSNADARRFYEIEANSCNWSVRELERQIGSSLYERLALSRDKGEVHKLAKQGQVIVRPADLIKDPLVLEFLNLDQRTSYSESDLESAIIDKLESFLLELGKGFLFEARQKRFTFENDHYYIDLVFYNRLLRCYVLLDLKIGKLTHQDLGQMQMYVNYYDRHVKLEDELPTIGIVLCAQKNQAVVELTLPENSNIFATKYQLYLPTKSELQAELQSITAALDVNGEI